MPNNDERTSHPKVESVSSIKRFDNPSSDGRVAGSVAARERSRGGDEVADGLRSSFLAHSSIVCKALLKTVRHKLVRLSVNSFSIPLKPSASSVIES